MYAGGWDSTISARPLTGCSHGASGIAYALALAHSVIHAPWLLSSAAAALAFERSAFDPGAGNWADYRWEDPAGQVRCSTSWCHGAPGMALSRLELMRHVDDAQCRAELDIAIATTRRAPWQVEDHPCCGTFGRIDLLSFVGAALKRDDLTTDAAALAASRLARGPAPRVTPESVPEFRNPGLFDGTAGVGYALLRLAAPGRLPCVLAFE